MKILIDECLPKRIIRHFPEHIAKTVVQAGWKSLKDGNLLQQAQHHFDVFITADQNIQFQQNIQNYDIAIIILVVYRNNMPHIIPLLPQIKSTLLSIEKSQIVHIP